MKYLIYTLSIFIIISSCNSNDSADNKNGPDTSKKVVRDTTITVKNSFSPKFLDSSELENFFKSQQTLDSVAGKMREFYAKRNYQYAWFTDSGFAEYGQGFVEMIDNYLAYAKDSSLYNKELRMLLDSFSTGPASTVYSPRMLETELLLSTQFFRYAHEVYEGTNALNQKDLGWFIPKKKVDPVAILDSLIKFKSNNFVNYEPLNQQYNLVKNELLKYYAVQKQLDSLPLVPLTATKNSLDSTATLVLEKRLHLLGDLGLKALEDNDKDSLAFALKRFQNRHGLSPTGSLNKQTINYLNLPTGARIKQMLINLERLKWVPVRTSSDYILVNIPEFRLHVYAKGDYKWSMKVVVGSNANSTVIFMGMLKYVVFSPYWNIPPSIIKKEIVPGISRNKNYLQQHNMEWNGGAVRQKPGPKNSLGLVKFLFPNSYNIYLHDTPAKSLFNESARAFSHGCIRLAEPVKLADFLLRDDSTWTKDKINQAMNAGKEKYVTVKQMIPVYIGYFTSWVDRDGILNFRDDIYGHDKKMAEKLFLQ